jgi:hypothetical protein
MWNKAGFKGASAHLLGFVYNRAITGITEGWHRRLSANRKPERPDPYSCVSHQPALRKSLADKARDGKICGVGRLSAVRQAQFDGEPGQTGRLALGPGEHGTPS